MEILPFPRGPGQKLLTKQNKNKKQNIKSNKRDMEVKFKANRKDNIDLWNYNFTLGHADMGLFAQLPMKPGRINLLFRNSALI